MKSTRRLLVSEKEKRLFSARLRSSSVSSLMSLVGAGQRGGVPNSAPSASSSLKAGMSLSVCSHLTAPRKRPSLTGGKPTRLRQSLVRKWASEVRKVVFPFPESPVRPITR